SLLRVCLSELPPPLLVRTARFVLALVRLGFFRARVDLTTLKVATLTTASVTGFGIFGSASKAGLVSNAALSFGPYTAPSPLYLSPNATQLLFWISSIRL